jgi:hypothetical protein
VGPSGRTGRRGGIDEAGAFDEDTASADLLQQYEARIAALERLVGKTALELEFPKGGSEKPTAAEKHEYVRHCRPPGLSIAKRCRLMGISRSSFYEQPISVRDAAAIAP